MTVKTMLLGAIAIVVGADVAYAGVRSTGAAGPAFRDAAWAPEMIPLPTGSAAMGSTEAEAPLASNPKSAAMERPRHVVRLTGSLAMARYLVTIGDYERFIRATGHAVAPGCMVLRAGVWARDEQASFRSTDFPTNARSPVTCVDAGDADAYAAWLSQTTGHHYRLPREAELEYAIRAGTTTVRWWGDDTNALCTKLNGADRAFDSAYPGNREAYRNCSDGFVQTSPVGHFPANPWGLYDMLGNVEQWSSDCFTPTYDGAPQDISTAIPTGDCSQRPVRGGTFHSGPNLFRAAARGMLPAGMKASSVGFRVVRED